MTTRITHICGPTVLLEVDGWRLLTDLTFDPPGRRYGFGWGSSSHKLTGPSIAPADLGPIDAVLLSHTGPTTRARLRRGQVGPVIRHSLTISFGGGVT